MNPSTARLNPNYGRGTHTLELDGDSVQDEAQRLRAWLDGFLDDPTAELPRLPSVALEILDLTQKANARIEDIGALLDREPMLAAKVLRLANSALYGTTVPCTSLKGALIRMGISVVRDVVMEAAFHMTVIRADGFAETLEEIRRHATAVAWVSRFVARNTPMEAENAFLIGLLKDLGLSVGVIGLAEFLKAARVRPRLTPDRWHAVEQNHELIGERLLASWKLPPALTYVVGHHHLLNNGGHPHPSVAVLMIAEAIVNNAGWNIKPCIHVEGGMIPYSGQTEHFTQAQTAAALEALNLTEKHFATFTKDTAKVLQTLAAQFHTPLK